MGMGFDFDIGSAIGGIASSYMSGKAAKKAAQMQIAWERERAQNAHQWEVADLKAAGLNPILSAGGQGAMTSAINPPMPDYSGISGISSASSAAKQARTAEKAQKKDAELKDAEIEAVKAKAELDRETANNTALEAQYNSARNAAQLPLFGIEENYNKSGIGKGLRYMNLGLRDASPVLNLFSLGLGGLAIRHAVGKATTALKAAQAAKGGQMIQNNFPKGWKSPGLRPIERWENVPTIYRNGYRTH